MASAERTKLNRKILLGSAGALLVLAIITASLSALAYSYQNKIPPNTYVAGVSVGGKTPEEAVSLVTEQAAVLAQTNLTITNTVSSSTATLADLGIELLPESTIYDIAPVNNPWEWLKPVNVPKIFQKKQINLHYETNQEKLTSYLVEKIGGATASENAKITVENDSLTVTSAKNGEAFDIESIVDQLSEQILAGSLSSINVTHAPTQPEVSTQMAQTVKESVSQAITTIYISGEGKGYALTPAEIYRTLQYSVNNGVLTWSVGSEALKDVLTKKIANKINVKMAPRTIQSDTGAVTYAGREGKSVKLDELVAATKSAIENHTATTKETPITFDISTVAISEKIVNPDYQIGLYEGKYVNVNLAKQKMYLVNGSSLVAEYSVSTGKWGTPTPKGTMYIKNKISMAYSNPFRLWMPYWSGLSENADGSGYKGYGIHGLPCFNSDCTLREGESHIGTPVSHGCIRVPTDVVAFVYEWATVGTPVVIF